MRTPPNTKLGFTEMAFVLFQSFRARNRKKQGHQIEESQVTRRQPLQKIHDNDDASLD
jgi:hypothetical protein